MKRITAVLAATAACASLAQAEPPAPSTSTPVTVPGQLAPSQPLPPGDRSVNTGIPGNAKPSDANDCSAWVKANNPRLSAAEVKDYCERDLKPTSPQD